MNLLIIIYVAFVSLIILALVIFMLKLLNRIKKTMWNTNLILKIIPESILSQQDQDQIKAFFVS